MPARKRLDEELVARGLMPNITEARKAIDAKAVLVNSAPALKASGLVSAADKLKIQPAREFVSRAGRKLKGALEDLEVSVVGRRCLDAGAGSGGFTQCLLNAGADHVVAVDVGYGQFDWLLRNHPRVTLLERTNIRDVKPDKVGGPFDLVVADLSFMSVKSAASPLAALASAEAALVIMVKPQHEAPREDVGAKGIVRDPAVWRKSVKSVVDVFESLGFATAGVAPARIKGAEGNQEFFILATRPGKSDPGAVDRAISFVE